MKPTLTVGIAAHNEEAKIGPLIRSLLMQVAEDFVLDSIVIMCDGCTDRTSEQARSASAGDPRVVILEDERRIGKIGRLNSIFSRATSDVVVILDADIRIQDARMLSKLMSGCREKGAGLIAGLPLPEKPERFWEKVFFTWESIWIASRKDLNNGLNIHNVLGCCVGLTRDLYTDLCIPPKLIAEDEFLFFSAQNKQLGMVFAEDAHVYYRLPSSLREYFFQSVRYIDTKHDVLAYFKKESHSPYAVPFLSKLRAIYSVFIRSPFFTIIAIALQIPIRLYAALCRSKFKDNTWEVAESTKSK